MHIIIIIIIIVIVIIIIIIIITTCTHTHTHTHTLNITYIHTTFTSFTSPLGNVTLPNGAGKHILFMRCSVCV